MMPSDPPLPSSLESQEKLETALQSAWNRGAAESSPLALILVEFDKPETAVGVGILERALRVHCARTHDVFLRRANDEFVAVLPDTSPAGARHVGEQIIEAMHAEDTDHAQSVSIGVAVSVPDDHRDSSELLCRAESALKAAHDNGGDRVVGGGAARTEPSATPKSAFAHLRELLPGRKKKSNQKRSTD